MTGTRVGDVGRSVGLRTQILLMLLGAAILPLALVGIRLTFVARDSGETLLRNHLDASRERMVAAIAARWTWRRADIGFLTEGNEATLAALEGSLSREQSSYLEGTTERLMATIPEVEFRNQDGMVRWYTSPASRAAARRERGDRGVIPAENPGPLARVEVTINDEGGLKVGVASFGLALSGLIPSDSTMPLVPGATVGIRSSRTGAVLRQIGPAIRFPDSDLLEVNGERWIAAHDTVPGPDLEIAVIAPAAPYVDPSARAASYGIIALAVVGLMAIAVTVVLATRATEPLRELVDASDAVTRGQLERRVLVRGPTEIRRVGAAFNMMTDHLRSTLDTLARRSALAAVGEFATSLSHDVRNALTAIKVDLDRIARRPVSDPVTRSLIDRSINNVARLENAVSAALRVSRTGQSAPVDVDLRAPIASAMEMVAGAFASVPARLEANLGDVPLIVRGDAAALKQLFANLLFNSAQALAPGGHARIDVSRSDGGVEVSCRDSGAGITPDEMRRIDTPFYSSKENGTGLGLPIARQIVAAHRGQLSISSVKNAGTTVVVRLPVLNELAAVGERVVQGASEISAVDAADKL